MTSQQRCFAGGLSSNKAESYYSLSPTVLKPKRGCSTVCKLVLFVMYLWFKPVSANIVFVVLNFEPEYEKILGKLFEKKLIVTFKILENYFLSTFSLIHSFVWERIIVPILQQSPAAGV